MKELIDVYSPTLEPITHMKEPRKETMSKKEVEHPILYAIIPWNEVGAWVTHTIIS